MWKFARFFLLKIAHVEVCDVDVCIIYKRKGVQETRDWNVFEHLTSYFLIQKQVKRTQIDNVQ